MQTKTKILIKQFALVTIALLICFLLVIFEIDYFDLMFANYEFLYNTAQIIGALMAVLVILYIIKFKSSDFKILNTIFRVLSWIFIASSLSLFIIEIFNMFRFSYSDITYILYLTPYLITAILFYLAVRANKKLNNQNEKINQENK